MFHILAERRNKRDALQYGSLVRLSDTENLDSALSLFNGATLLDTWNAIRLFSPDWRVIASWKRGERRKG